MTVNLGRRCTASPFRLPQATMFNGVAVIVFFGTRFCQVNHICSEFSRSDCQFHVLKHVLLDTISPHDLEVVFEVEM